MDYIFRNPPFFNRILKSYQDLEMDTFLHKMIMSVHNLFIHFIIYSMVFKMCANLYTILLYVKVHGVSNLVSFTLQT